MGPDFSETKTEGALGLKASWKLKWFGEEPHSQAALPLPALDEHLFTEVVYLLEAPCPESEALALGSWLRASCGARHAAPHDLHLWRGSGRWFFFFCIFVKICQGEGPPVS